MRDSTKLTVLVLLSQDADELAEILNASEVLGCTFVCTKVSSTDRAVFVAKQYDVLLTDVPLSDLQVLHKIAPASAKVYLADDEGGGKEGLQVGAEDYIRKSATYLKKALARRVATAFLQKKSTYVAASTVAALAESSHFSQRLLLRAVHAAAI